MDDDDDDDVANPALQRTASPFLQIYSPSILDPGPRCTGRKGTDLPAWKVLDGLTLGIRAS